MRERIHAFAGDFRARSASEQTAAVLTLGIVLLGLWLRFRGFFSESSSLWLDECEWASRTIERPLVDHLIRPIGFMAVTKLLIALFGAYEPVVRALPWLFGLALPPLAAAVAPRLFRNPAARVLFVAVLVLHPGGIDMAKEFKPYAASLTLHVLLAWCTLRYWSSRRASDLAVALGCAAFALLFAQDSVFAFPGLFLVLGYRALGVSRRHRNAVIGGALLVLLIIGGQYFLIWTRMSHSNPEYWGGKYNVFYLPNPDKSHLEWLFGRYSQMAGWLGLRDSSWDSEDLAKANQLIWMLLHVLGCVMLAVRRRVLLATLLALPIATLVLFNTLGLWPFGAFRTNLFVVFHLAGIAAVSFDDGKPVARAWLVPIPAFVLVLAPLFAFEDTWHARKTMLATHSSFRQALGALLRLSGSGRASGERELLVLERRACVPYHFYTEHHPVAARELGEQLAKRFEVRCIKEIEEVSHALEVELAQGRRGFVLAHGSRRFEADLKKSLQNEGRFTIDRSSRSHLVFRVTASPAPAK
ncbi:MAG TPA: glycosyltransferase family 39 protein [Polyangiaceae bacterium]